MCPKKLLIITTVMISLIIINEETFDERRDGLVCENTMLTFIVRRTGSGASI